MLRLRGEAEDEILDEADDPQLSDRITARDAFPEDGLEADEQGNGPEPDGRPSLVRGLGIATATFVPTFLAILFGVPYLLDSAVPAHSPIAPIVAPTAPVTSGPSPRATSPRSGTIGDPFLAPRVSEPPATRPPDPGEPTRSSEPRESAVVVPPPSTPTPPPGPPRAAEPRVAAEVPAAEPPEPEPSRQAVVPPPAPERSPAVEPRKSAPDWAPAAAFTDREAANRLASSIQQQGYPVEIRQDRSSTRPWVVWIGAEPRGGTRRR
ncbi:MAG: hypothetical protein ACREK9_01680 [Candidatus Rokuibacteriota bacterium]